VKYIGGGDDSKSGRGAERVDDERERSGGTDDGDKSDGGETPPLRPTKRESRAGARFLRSRLEVEVDDEEADADDEEECR